MDRVGYRQSRRRATIVKFHLDLSLQYPGQFEITSSQPACLLSVSVQGGAVGVLCRHRLFRGALKGGCLCWERGAPECFFLRSWGR